MSDDPVKDVAEALLAYLCAELSSRPNPPDICCLHVGDVVVQDIGILLDTCCVGQAYVRVAGVYPSSEFPAPEGGAVSPCGLQTWAVALEMGVFRCLPSEGSTEPMTCEQWATSATTAFSDGQALRRAACRMANLTETGTSVALDLSVGQVVPAGPDGNCVGQTLLVTVQVSDDCSC